MINGLLPIGEDPKAKGRSVYRTPEEVAAANAFAKAFAARKNPYGVVSPQDVYVAQKPGDPVVPFVEAGTGLPFAQTPGKVRATRVPDYVNLEDIQGGDGAFWYETRDGQTVELDPAVFQTTPRFRKSLAEQQKTLATRQGLAQGLIVKN